MATAGSTINNVQAGTKPKVGERPAATFTFQMVFLLLLAWLVGGGYLDGWAHNHGRVDDVFFTPWHAVLYSGFAACALYLGAFQLWNVSRGYSLYRALPRGFELSQWGIVVFALGGVGDFLWHEAFGIEVGAEALLSPSHTLLVLGTILLGTGPIRAAWHRRDENTTWKDYLPLVLSMALVYSAVTFISSGMSVFSDPMPTVHTLSLTGGNGWFRYYLQMFAVAGTIAHMTVFMGMLLLAVRRFGSKLPFGTITLILGINILLMSTQLDQYRHIPGVIVTGVIADFMLWRLRPSAERRFNLRFFALFTPIVLYTIYFLTLALTDQIWWRMHTVTGLILMSGFVGLFVSYLVFPPRSQVEVAP